MVLLAKDDVKQPSVIGYLPVIPASPTELSTVYLLLKCSLAVADALNQHGVVMVLDQAIYALAQDIVAKHQREFKRVVLRLGDFHICMTLLTVIGKRFADAGLHSILVESGIVGPSAVATVLSVKHFNRAIRCHKVIMEALFRLCWQSFERWLLDQPQHQKLSEAEQQAMVNVLCDLRARQCKTSLHVLLSEPAYARLRDVFCSYMESLQSPLAKLWISYFKMVQLLQQFVRKSRKGLWHLHLQAVHHMLPWMFAYDHPS